MTQGVSVIKSFVKTLDDQPGVYRMLDEAGQVLYVGKAKRLKRRVISYTQPVESARIALMIEKTASMMAVTTTTENEALVLEQQLVKELNPPFNVRLKDGRNYPGILLTTSHNYPKLVRHRGRVGKKDTFFGPFADGKAVEHAIRQVQRLFLLRTCDEPTFQGRTRPCLLHQIHKCTAPCVGKVSKEEYDDQVQDALKFLTGKKRDILTKMQESMMSAAQEENFELAARLRDRLRSLSQIQEEQNVVLRGVDDADIIALHQEGGQACVQVMFLRNGQMRGNSEHHLANTKDATPSAIMDAFIPQFYTKTPPPSLVLCSHRPTDLDWIVEALSEQNKRQITLTVPQRGERKRAVLNAERNAKNALARKQASTQAWTNNLDGLAKVAGIDGITQVEVYDNSHIQGAHAVGVAVVATAEGFAKSHYRKYNFDKDSGVAGNDVGMMKAMLTRRFKRLVDEESTLPDLLLIDGGITQLHAAMESLASLSLTIPCIGVAKGEDRNAGKEMLYFENGDVVALERTDPILYFIQRLRDEAHRFAITTHRNKRSKAQNKGPLDEIPGLGPSRKRALTMRFGSQKAAASASLTELSQVAGISESLAQKIVDARG